jgi:hypothetical protein
LKDAIKIAERKDEDKRNGILNREGYISEATSIIEGDEDGDEGGESELSENSKQSSHKDIQEEDKEIKEKSDKKEDNKQTQREPRQAKITAVDNIHNSSLKSDHKLDEEEVKVETHQRPKRKSANLVKTSDTNGVKLIKSGKKNTNVSSSSSNKPRDKKMIRKQQEENSETMSDNFQQKDQIKINGMIKNANRKKLDSLLRSIAFVRIKLDNVLNEKFKATDLAAEENSVKILGDLIQLDNLYTNKIDEHIRVNTLCKTGISKTLHKFQRY